MFLLDTNVLSELRKLGDGRADPGVVSWIAAAPHGACRISALTAMELEIGVLRAERRDPAQGGLLRAWLDRRVRPAFAGRVLAVDDAVALRCARLHLADPLPGTDAPIAATALVHGLTVVTRNMADFAPSGVATLNPWAIADPRLSA